MDGEATGIVCHAIRCHANANAYAINTSAFMDENRRIITFVIFAIRNGLKSDSIQRI